MERGKKWQNEYEVVPYSLFTLSSFYPTDPGLGRRVVERPIGTRRQDLQEAVSTALAVLNRPQPKLYTVKDFAEGLYRMDPIEGTTYEMWFAHQPSGNASAKVTLIRPHAPLTVVSTQQNLREPVLNIVVPLAGRLLAFQSFLSRFKKKVLMVSNAKRIHLTVVFFGDELWGDVQREMLALEKSSGFSNFHLLNTKGNFSRARGLQIGVEHWEGGDGGSLEDVLIFLCDVDVDFDAHFLKRCRRNSRPKRTSIHLFSSICLRF